MERQETEIKAIQKVLSNAESMWKELPKLADVANHMNNTLSSIEKTRNDILENDEKCTYVNTYIYTYT